MSIYIESHNAHSALACSLLSLLFYLYASHSLVSWLSLSKSCKKFCYSSQSDTGDAQSVSASAAPFSEKNKTLCDRNQNLSVFLTYCLCPLHELSFLKARCFAISDQVGILKLHKPEKCCFSTHAFTASALCLGSLSWRIMNILPYIDTY